MKAARSADALWAKVAVLLLYCSSAGVLSVRAADPDPLVDVNPNADTFILRDVFTNGDVTVGTGGTRAGLNVSIFPALLSEGITYVHFRMKPCGENLPHTHPRATEILTMVSGGPIQVGVVETSGPAHVYILYPGDLVVFPRGLLHFELNVGAKEAFYISALNSQNPGVLTQAQALLSLPLRAAAGALNEDAATTEKLKENIAGYDSRLKLVSEASGCVPNKDITTGF